jgi:quinone-modifying oxidoreductase subunit QmoC
MKMKLTTITKLKIVKMARVNPKFSAEIKKYGADDFNACFNCGTCTATCSLSDEKSSFPREMVRYSALGLESEITSSLKPWQCYYCGECSTDCPRKANPGELMMSLRRWLTAKYDWTGLSAILYKSFASLLIFMIVVAAGVIAVAFAKDFNLNEIIHFGHYFEMYAIAGVFATILLPNIIRMWYFTVIKPGKKVPFKRYISSMADLFIHMFTQKRALGCDDNQTRWFAHFVLVIGYLTLLFTTVFLDWFSSESMFVVVLGYVVSAVVFVVTLLFVLSRIKQKTEVTKHSRPSDWMFVAWLFLMGVTAFAVRLFIDLEILESNLWLYLFHLTILAQWALIIVPFGKWTHFLYRSFAIYFEKLLEGKK